MLVLVSKKTKTSITIVDKNWFRILSDISEFISAFFKQEPKIDLGEYDDEHTELKPFANSTFKLSNKRTSKKWVSKFLVFSKFYHYFIISYERTPKNLHCSTCLRRFTTGFNLRRHIKTCQRSSNLILNNFPTKEEWIQHIRKKAAKKVSKTSKKKYVAKSLFIW